MRYLLSVLALLALTAPNLNAQDGGLSVTGTIYGGGFVPSQDLSDGTKFTNSTLYGAGLTLWTGNNLGIRGSVLWTRSEVDGVSLSPLENQDPAIILYNADLLLKPSFRLLGWNPYIFGGIGAKHYALTKFNRAEGYSAFSGSAGAGLDLDLGRRWGLQAEARHIFGGFKHYDYDDTQRDWAFAGGITFKF